jgi:hypothetical protein
MPIVDHSVGCALDLFRLDTGQISGWREDGREMAETQPLQIPS